MRKINEVSALAGISKRTLQYYDDEGVLPVQRSANNERLYSDEDLVKLWKIMLYKEIGFKLIEIKHVCALSEQEQLEAVVSRISVMIENKNELVRRIRLAETVRDGAISLSDELYSKEGMITYAERLKTIIETFNASEDVL